MVNDKWLIPDLNDRDHLGNIRYREVSIPDYSISELISKVPGIKLNPTELVDQVSALKQGKTVDIMLKSSKYPYQIEANPLTRSITFYKDGKKVNLSNDGQKQRPKSMAFESKISDGQTKKHLGI